MNPLSSRTCDSSWVRNPIDAFILAGLESQAVRPSSEASRTTLIRRLSLDLTGLPPTPEEVNQFIQDTSSDAYDHLVDRLLASPHYGEKWARYWLDQARYGDSDGFETDAPRPFAWRFDRAKLKAFLQRLAAHEAVGASVRPSAGGVTKQGKLQPS